MAEEAADRTLYGQFGRTTYDHDGKKWHFERNVDSNIIFETLGDPKVIVTPAVERATTFASIKDPAGLSRRLEKQNKALVQSHPELQPASDLLPELARVSEAVEDAAHRHDPMQGELFALGFIPDKLNKSSAEVVAIPSGPNGSDLRIVQVLKQDESQEYSDKLATRTREGAIWHGPGAAIQAIIFATPIEQGDAFLAVRLWTETLIFRPMLTKSARRGSSRLDVNLVFRLSINETGGLTHAHVSYNPWSSRQLSIIDQAGYWSVRELREEQNWSLEEVSHGSLMDDLNDSKRTLVDDGWARILWTGDPTIIAICNRRKLSLFDLEAHEPYELQGVSTVLDDGLGWNLDMTVVRLGSDYLLLLTTAHILIYLTTRDDLRALAPKCLICLRHFRNPGDISLRFHIFQKDGEALIFIRSDLSSTIICYRMNVMDADRLAISDPTELILPVISHSMVSTAAVSSLNLRSLPVVMNDDLSFEEFLTDYEASRDARYYSITTLHKDLSLRETLCLTKPRGRLQHVVPPSGEDGSSNEGNMELPRMIMWNENFPKNPSVQEIRREPVSTYVQGRTVPTSSRYGNDWTISYELSLRDLDDIDDFNATDVDGILDKARMKLQTQEISDEIPIQTLRELSEGELALNNLFEGMASLNDLWRTEVTKRTNRISLDDSEPAKKPERVILHPIDWPPTLNLYHAEGSNRLPSLHKLITDNWISPLPDDITEIVRSKKEQHALRMATEVALASHTIRPEEFLEDQVPMDQSRGDGLVLPVRPFDVPTSSRATPTSSVYFDASTRPHSPQPLTQSRSSTPSTILSSGQRSSFVAPEIARLSRYVAFSQPPPRPLPRSLNRVLLHWVPGTDPADYDWQVTSHRFARQEEEEDGQELSAKQQRRLQRRAERNVRRQVREAEKSERLQMLSSQAPEIATESQPSQIAGGQNFVASMGSSQMPASQILPGRHGGRHPAKKKRKSGF